MRQDVHHGNGIQHILEANPHILYISIHRGAGFYPGTGAAAEVGTAEGTGLTVNVRKSPYLLGGGISWYFASQHPTLRAQWPRSLHADGQHLRFKVLLDLIQRPGSCQAKVITSAFAGKANQ